MSRNERLWLSEVKALSCKVVENCLLCSVCLISTRKKYLGGWRAELVIPSFASSLRGIFVIKQSEIRDDFKLSSWKGKTEKASPPACTQQDLKGLKADHRLCIPATQLPQALLVSLIAQLWPR